MPKKKYVMNNFNGGINNDADPRDIAENQFAELQNVAVDEMGKIIVLGDIGTTYKSITGAITGAGTGVFALSTDHTGLLDGVIATPGQTYYLIENGNQVTGAGSTDETGNIACDMNEATMFYVDGALRIAEADLTSNNVSPQWRGYISAKTYGPASTDADASIAEQWSTQNAEIAGAFPVYQDDTNGIDLCRNALMVNQFRPLAAGSDSTFSFEEETVSTHDDTYDGGAVIADASGHRWGFALEFGDDVNGSGQWMPTTSTRYRFYVTTMYDNHTQESLPQLMQHWGSDLFASGGTTYVGDTVQNEIKFTNGSTYSETGEMIAVWFAPVIKFNYSNTTNFNFGATDLDGDGSTADADKGNPRISGIKVYWSSNEDGYSTLWQLFDINFEKGVNCLGIDGSGSGTLNYAPFTEAGAPSEKHATVDWLGSSSAVANRWTIPPRYIQYDTSNSHAPTDTIKIDAYKAAVVANRRVYIGNVKQDGVIYGDRMLKSPINQFDKFPSVNNIDVAINDGDDIVALVEYADRILQFKRNTCYIINVSGSSEYLETEHKYKGITNPGAVCRTDYGAAWVNQTGCYLYDGQGVANLLEAKGNRKISHSTWASFIGDNNYHRIGFNPKKRQLIVLQGTTGNDAYVYDMVTQSWTFSNNMVVDGDTGSNFINDPIDGSLLIFDDGGDTLDKWADTPVIDSTPAIVIATKDLDLGEPSIRKKLFKIYVTYKGDGSSITANYRTNGGTTDYNFAAGFGNESEWTQLELKPSTASEANNIYSMQLRLTGSCATNFMINDITFVYRAKSVK